LQLGPTKTRWAGTYFFVLFAISVATNLILMSKLYFPGYWRAIELALISVPPESAEDHVRGAPEAKVTIIEYADFQCPFCAELHSSLRKAVTETDSRWVYRHFTLDKLHPQARELAEASECAGAQGRFWDYADAVFATVPAGAGEVGEKTSTAVASYLHLDTTDYQKCVASERYRERIEQATRQGAKLKISGTPTIFINGERFVGSMKYPELEKIIKNKLSGAAGAG